MINAFLLAQINLLFEAVLYCAIDIGYVNQSQALVSDFKGPSWGVFLVYNTIRLIFLNTE